MRIGIEVQNMFRPKKNGADIIVIELLKHLEKRVSKHEMFVYAQNYKHNESAVKKQHTHVAVSGPASANVWEQQLLPKAIKEHHIGLLHCTGNTAPVGLKVPLILTIHNVNYLEKSTLHFGSWYQRFEHLYAQWNVPKIAAVADLIITVSNYEREQIIEKLHVAPSKVRTVYHACAPHFNSSINNVSLAATKYHYRLPEKFILYFGSEDPKRNMATVLKAMNFLFQTGKLTHQLVIPDLSQCTLRQLLLLHGYPHLENKIHLTGYIPNYQLPNIYKLASLFLYPTLHESFGLPILEAMACGTPVIAGNSGAIPEIAGRDAFLFDATQPCVMADTIIKVLQDAAINKKVIEHGLQRSKLFSWEKTTSEILDIYEQFNH